MSGTKQICTFEVDGCHFGIDVQRVQEILRSVEMTRIPLAPRSVRGLVNLRGEIVTAIDLRRRLGRKEATGEGQPLSVIVRSSDGIVSLLVDAIGDVYDVPVEQFESPPDTLEPRTRSVVSGVCKLDSALTMMLDTEAIFGAAHE